MTRYAHICDALRTPFSRYGGVLAPIRAGDLAALPLRATMARHPDLDWEALTDVILACANQACEDNRNVARTALLLAVYRRALERRRSTAYAARASMRW